MLNQIKNRAAREDGWVLVTAVVVMVLMLGVGLALLNIVDTQQKQSREQRVRESSFNLSEGMLYQQSQILSRRWPDAATSAYPSSCTQANYGTIFVGTTTTTNYCTDPTTVTTPTGGLFSGPDYGGTSNVTWDIQVRDNGNAQGQTQQNYIKGTADGTQAKCSNPSFTVANCVANGGTATTCNPTAGTFCTWDFNGDKQIFVRVNATARGKTRRLVALLKLEFRKLKFNGGVATSGWLQSTTSTNHPVIDAQGTSATTSGVVLRCPSQNATYNGNTCNTLDQGKGQLSPSGAISYGTDPGTALNDTDLATLIGSADFTYSGTTNAACPSTLSGWTGVVVIDISPATTCTLSTPNNDSMNCDGTVSGTRRSSNPSPSGFGVIVMLRGKIQVPNNTQFCGVILAANQSSPQQTGVLVDIGAGAEVIGAVAVDGPGGISVHQDNSIEYDPDALNLVSGSGTAGLVQSTWRELTPSQ